ncbi:hypothetical protein [Bradyrhizobium sp. WSM4349]|uniref:hypothetical protein n=1 Tax=Bradyrhizobium sp. WSM4349 TaxID=1040988 RepID=UPI0012FB0621|nr:hypothetical protein [Bradyrhizobium sp. WSM4349]
MSLFEHTQIVAAEEIACRKLLSAFETSHKRNLVSSGDEELIVDSAGAGLSAVCLSARTCWAHFLCGELERYFAYNNATRATNQKVFFFTLVDISCARSRDERKIALKPIIRKLERGLKGRDFIGVLEPGLYSHIDARLKHPFGSSLVSWHLHVLVWGVSRNDVKRLARKLNKSKRYIPLSPGQDGVFQRGVREGELSRALSYIMKPPISAYRLGRRRESTDGKASFIQYRSNLRPGERLTLYLHMRHLSLPETWIAGGKGSALLGTVKRRSRAAIRRFERLSDAGKADRRRSVFRHSSLLSTIRASEARKPIL